MVRQLASFAPDAFCLHDAPDCAIDLPRFRFPEPSPATAGAARGADCAVPHIDAAQVMAYVFTSGSVGMPVPHRKTWGFLVRDALASAKRLGLSAPGAGLEPGSGACTLIGTVPPQHMYGFESTVLLPLIGGLAFSNRQPFYPADVRAELAAVPKPRVLVTTPVHLRALLASDHALPDASLVLSATAPLARKLAVDAEARLGAPLVEIYGSTETGQIASRRTAQSDAWHLLPGVRLEPRAAADDDDGEPSMWASGGHVETPVPMGDALELLDDERFLLHGRKADLVNIAGKRTSLGYLNHQLTAIPGVEDGVFYMPDEAHEQPAREASIEPVTRLAALVVAPQLTAAGLLRALRERIDPAFLPRPLRFVDALPRNATGKLPRDVLAALVAQPPAPKAPTPRRESALTVTIAADHPALPGHFPGRPIVPGVVLLDHALIALGAALNRPLDGCRISSAKFLSPAAPGEPLDVAFETAASGSIRFTVSAGSREVASGVLSPAPAREDTAVMTVTAREATCPP
jgi:acyl-coenzyme A synthetase/AMP-(fatty) acid ligase